MTKRRCGACKQAFGSICQNGACPVGFYNVRNSNGSREDLPDPLEELCASNYGLGRVAVMEEMARTMFRDSGDLFAKKKDEEAMVVRRIAENIEKDAIAARAEWTKNFKDRKKS